MSSAYSSWVSNDNGALSVGILMFHATAARELFRRIRSTNQSEFDSLASSMGSSDFINKINSGDSEWTSFVLGKDTQWGRFITKVLDTDYGRQAQNELADSYISRYVDDIKKYGTEDDAVIIFMSDIWNQYGSAHPFCRQYLNASSTIDSIYNNWCNWTSNYGERRKRVYDKIKGLIKDGSLIESNGHYKVNTISTAQALTYKWPCPNHKTISKAYSSRSPYIEISDPTIKGANVIAAHDGIATFVKGTVGNNKGNYVVIKYESDGNAAMVQAAYNELNWAKNQSAPYKKYAVQWGGYGADWCAFFVSYCANQAKVSTDYLPAGAHGAARYTFDYNRSGKGVWHNRGSYTPKPGDAIVFKYEPNDPSYEASHIGIVVKVDKSNNRVYTIEGNTGNSSTSPYYMGSHVLEKDYDMNYFGIKGYSETSSGSYIVESEYRYLNSLTHTGTYQVKAGDKLGTVGFTGTNNYKLYFSLKEAGGYVDPTLKFKD